MLSMYLILFLTSLGVSLAIGKTVIKLLRSCGITQNVREDGPVEHIKTKANTPTIGGIIFLFPLILFSLILFLTNSNFQTTDFIVVVSTTFIAVLTGFIDDYLKVRKKRNKGVSGWTKLFVQLLISTFIAFIYNDRNILLYVIWVFFILAGASNSYNLTDGLDGLLASIASLSILGMLIFLNYNKYFELASFLAILLGGLLGFLYFNKHPAKVFMGDTGSLAIGAVVGSLTIVSKSELYLIFFATIPILEALSVILQVASCQFSKRFLGKDIRILKMAPLHHHFELCGWKEKEIVKRFFIFQFFCMIVGLLVLWFTRS